MNMLYDSDDFVVVYYPIEQEPVRKGRKMYQPPVRDGYEIVDKQAAKSVYLDGEWAAIFYEQIAAWQVETPEQEEVEEMLGKLCTLAQIPLVMH